MLKMLKIIFDRYNFLSFSKKYFDKLKFEINLKMQIVKQEDLNH